MTDNIKLPPMPKTEWNLHMPAQYYEHAWTSTQSGYTEADMENYAREAVRLNAQAVPDGWVLIATDAYEAGYGKGLQAAQTGKEIENPWGDEPGREAWSVGYTLAKKRAPAAPQPAQPLTDDPCPGCRVGKVCRTPKCGRLKLPVDHPLRTGVKND